MTNKQEKQLAIQRAVMAVMEENLSKWQEVSELKKNYDLFVRNLKKIDDSLADLALNPAPLRKSKEAARDKLVTKTFPVVSALSVYAIDSGDKKLARMTKVKEMDLKKLSNGDLKKYVGNTIRKCDSLLNPEQKKGKKKKPGRALTDYGITSEYIRSMESALNELEAARAELNETVTRKKQASIELGRRIKSNRKLLKKKMNRLMHLYREKDRAFFEAYFIAHVETEASKKETSPGKKPAGNATKQGGAVKTKARTAPKKSVAEPKRKAPASSASGSAQVRRPAK